MIDKPFSEHLHPQISGREVLYVLFARLLLSAHFQIQPQIQGANSDEVEYVELRATHYE